MKNLIKRFNENKKHHDIDPLGEENWEEDRIVKTICGEQVDVYVMVVGDYCSFDEIYLRVVYDITNDHQVGHAGLTKEELDNWNFDDHDYRRDVNKFKAIKVENKYYVKL